MAMTAIAAIRSPLSEFRTGGARTKNAARVGVVLLMVVIAYHYSLLSLVQSMGLETPLAYVGLAPFIALFLALMRSRTEPYGPSIHDRQVDYIIGLPLLAVALAINLVFPHRLSSMFWVWRIDLLSLPFFVAGAVCTVFGVRAMWRQRLPIMFLFFAWPWPYQQLLVHFLNGFTNLTLTALKQLLKVVPIAHAVPTADGSLFQVVHGKPFQISVVSACSGVNGMVGFLLVGTAFAAVVRGPRIRKAFWLAGGLSLLWATNLLRIMFIFWSGREWGQKVAIDFFHPFIGLVMFNIGIVIMIVALGPIGLYIDGSMWGRHREATTAAQANRSAPALAVHSFRSSIILVVILGSLLSVTNAGLKSYDFVANALGTPRLASFSDFPAAPDGWRAEKADVYDWAKPYFGSSSTWIRYTMFPGADPTIGLHTTQAVVADVISTSNLRSFSAYGVEACYRFHGYKLRNIASASLGGGVTAQTLSYYNSRQSQDWTVVYWIWPVRTRSSTRYERVTLYLQNTPGTETFSTPTNSHIHSLFGGLSSASAVDRKLVNIRTFLVEVAREVVHNQGAVQVGAQLPSGGSLAVQNQAGGTLATTDQQSGGGSGSTPQAAPLDSKLANQLPLSLLFRDGRTKPPSPPTTVP